MKEFKITITETSVCTVDVEAETYEEAIRKVEADYWNDPNAYILEADETTFE